MWIENTIYIYIDSRRDEGEAAAGGSHRTKGRLQGLLCQSGVKRCAFPHTPAQEEPALSPRPAQLASIPERFISAHTDPNRRQPVRDAHDRAKNKRKDSRRSPSSSAQGSMSKEYEYENIESSSSANHEVAVVGNGSSSGRRRFDRIGEGTREAGREKTPPDTFEF